MKICEVLNYFPSDFSVLNEEISNIEEIRIRAGCPIILRSSNKEIVTKKIMQINDIVSLLESFCNNSLYSMQNDINNGFVTIKGGHRVGISGTGVFENGLIKNLKYISSLNIRIAREISGCSLSIFRKNNTEWNL